MILRKHKRFMFLVQVVFLSSSLLFAQDYKALLKIGKNYLLNNHHGQPQALKALEQAYSFKQDDVEAILWLGRAYYENRMYDKAKPLFEKVVEKSPDNADGHAFLSYTLGRLGEKNLAVQASYKVRAMGHLNKAVKLDPKNHGYYIAWGVGYHFLKLYGKAEENFKKAISLNPKDPWCFAQLGRTYLATKKINEAKKMFDKAESVAGQDIKSGMKNDSAMRGVALYYEEFMMWDDALAAAKKALSWNPKDLALSSRYSIKKVITRLEQEKKQNKLLIKNISEEL